MEFNGLLTVLTFFPLIGVAAILLLKPIKRESDNLIRGIAIGTSVITLLISVIVLVPFQSDQSGLQLIDRADWITVGRINIDYFLAVDGISILFILLTTFITLLAIISSWSAIQSQVKAYYVFMLLLLTGMIGVFLAQDLFLFYIFWEFTLIPMYFLIGIWGGGKRVYASIKFFLYTMAGSLLMLLAILWLGFNERTFQVPDLIGASAGMTTTVLNPIL